MDRPVHAMKVIEIHDMKITKAGKTFHLPGPIKVNMLLQNMESKESYIYLRHQPEEVLRISWHA